MGIPSDFKGGNKRIRVFIFIDFRKNSNTQEVVERKKSD